MDFNLDLGMTTTVLRIWTIFVRIRWENNSKTKVD
jgi:hypothetical protein